MSLTHSGSANPTTEGFSVVNFGATSSWAPATNNLGQPTWRIWGSGRSSQRAGMVFLTPGQIADLAAHGFTMSFNAQVGQLQSPAYDTQNHVVIAGVGVMFSGRRYEVALGIDGSGNTIAVVPSSVDALGPEGATRAPGPSFVIPGRSAHTYTLIFDPVTQTADLFIDGLKRFDNYSGHTSFTEPPRFGFGAWSGGTGQFAHVQLIDSIREPEVPFEITRFALGDGSASISWPSQDGVSYEVEYSPDLTEGSWEVVSDSPIPGDGTVLIFEDTSHRIDARQGYWRVRTPP